MQTPFIVRVVHFPLTGGENMLVFIVPVNDSNIFKSDYFVPNIKPVFLSNF